MIASSRLRRNQTSDRMVSICGTRSRCGEQKRGHRWRLKGGFHSVRRGHHCPRRCGHCDRCIVSSSQTLQTSPERTSCRSRHQRRRSESRSGHNSCTAKRVRRSGAVEGEQPRRRGEWEHRAGGRDFLAAPCAAHTCNTAHPTTW